MRASVAQLRQRSLQPGHFISGLDKHCGDSPYDGELGNDLAVRHCVSEELGMRGHARKQYVGSRLLGSRHLRTCYMGLTLHAACAYY